MIAMYNVGVITLTEEIPESCKGCLWREINTATGECCNEGHPCCPLFAQQLYNFN